MKHEKSRFRLNVTNTKIVLYLFLILFYNSVFSQQQLKTDFNYNATSLKFNSTSLVDNLSFPTVEIAIEKNLGKSYTIQFEGGIQLYELSKESIDTTNVKRVGHRIRIEGRYYFKNSSFDKTSTIKVFYFSGANFFYRYNTYNINYRLLKENVSAHNSFSYYVDDNIGVKKKAHGANLLFGSKIFMGNKLFVEPAIYLGIINRKIKNLDRDTQSQNDLKSKISAKEYRDLEESSGTILNLSVALRLGLII